MAGETRPYRYLNRDGLWPGFSWEGLELDAGGTLRLMALPRLEGALPETIAALAGGQTPAGIAVDRDGTVFFSDPAAAVVYRIDGCSGDVERQPCLGGRGSEPMRFSEPTALVIPQHRRVLYVADSGNHRIQVFDLATMALVDIRTGFERPGSLASDDEGHLYVVDTSKKRVDQFTAFGDFVPSFWETVDGSGRVADPRAVACDGDRVYVLDAQTHHVCILNVKGELLEEADTLEEDASAFAVISGAFYVGDANRRRIAVFRRNREGAYTYTGDAAGYEGPVAALAADGRGGLLVLPGAGGPPLRLLVDASHRPEGWIASGAIWFDEVEHYWNRLHATIDRPADTHVQFFVYAGAPSAPPPAPGGQSVFPSPWRAVENDVTDFFLTIGGKKTQALWIGARFDNDRHATPSLSQLRVDFDQDSYLPYLPAIYQERDCDDFLIRFLSLFEGLFDELEGKVDGLAALVNPAATPANALPWLAGFLALPLPETWNDNDQRKEIADAYARYGRRGTLAALREVLRIEAGVRAVIDEPVQAMGWWSMPAPSSSCTSDRAGTWTDGGDSILGINTMLAGAEPQGAVVGTTATLDRSQLITQDEYAAPLFDSVAYQFTVHVYPGEVECAGKLDQVRAIVDREKPAHTMYELCVIAPGLRVGYQARLGVDTLLGSGPAPGRLGAGELVLGGQPRGQVGIRSHVGVSTQL